MLARVGWRPTGYAEQRELLLRVEGYDAGSAEAEELDALRTAQDLKRLRRLAAVQVVAGPVERTWLVKAGQVSAGSVLSWFASHLHELDAPGRAELYEKVARIPVGGTGLVTLDYFMENRTPYRDPLLRGAVLGLSLGRGRAAIYRSALEGVALASANVLKRVKELNVPVDPVVTSGGYGKNHLWLQATVDAIGMPVHLSREPNLTIIGAAASAAAGAGLAAGLFEASAAVRQPAVEVVPDAKAYAVYQNLLNDYLEVTETLRPLSRRLASRQLGSGTV